MECPFCGKTQTRGEDKVLETRESDDFKSVLRRRRCSGCGSVFHTIETYGIWQAPKKMIPEKAEKIANR